MISYHLVLKLYVSFDIDSVERIDPNQRPKLGRNDANLGRKWSKIAAGNGQKSC